MPLPLALDQAHALLIAERSREATKITEAISAVLAANSETNLLEIEEVFRDAGSSVYLIAEPELTIVIGMSAWRSALDRLGMSHARKPICAGRLSPPPISIASAAPMRRPGDRKIPPA